MRVSAPQSPYRDCDIAIVVPEDPAMPARIVCTDAETGLIIGSPSILATMSRMRQPRAYGTRPESEASAPAIHFRPH
ncbi:hypothetical protein [Bradyrhizobium sp. 23AC]